MAEIRDGTGNAADSGKSVAVVGAGIVGVATAIWLQRAGHRVILIDRAEPGEGTSYGNGGVLASCSIVPVTVPGLLAKGPRMLFDPNQPLFLKWRYLPRLLPFLPRYLANCRADRVREIAAGLQLLIGDSLADHQALANGTPAEKWIVPSDYAFLYRDRAHFAGDSFGWDIRRRHGFSWDELEGDRLRAWDPVYSDIIGFAARLPGHGRISDPGRYVKDLAVHVERKGGRIVKADVEDIVRENGVAKGVKAAGETIAADAVVLTTGVWSGPLVRRLGLDMPLESERGYHVELFEPSVQPRAPVMVAAGKFVMTPMEGRLRLAGIVEFGGLDAPPSRAPIDLLLRNVRETLPGIRWSRMETWMGHRPVLPDSLPVIDAVPGMDGAFLGFGHQHIGLTAGPKTGRLLTQLVGDDKPNFNLAPYGANRFQ